MSALDVAKDLRSPVMRNREKQTGRGDEQQQSREAELPEPTAGRWTAAQAILAAQSGLYRSCFIEDSTSSCWPGCLPSLRMFAANCNSTRSSAYVGNPTPGLPCQPSPWWPSIGPANCRRQPQRAELSKGDSDVTEATSDSSLLSAS